MARSRILLAFLLFSLLASLLTALEEKTEEAKIVKINCSGECKRRCSLSSRPNLCKRACGTCCSRCNCVPPGTAGNKEACPCYAGLTTHGGRPKCP